MLIIKTIGISIKIFINIFSTQEQLKHYSKDCNPNHIFIFENDEIINQLFNSIIFVPFELYESYGYTSKKELIIFIGGLLKGFSKQIHYLSKFSSFLILGIHEVWSLGFRFLQFLIPR